jgi:hypothetical protein
MDFCITSPNLHAVYLGREESLHPGISSVTSCQWEVTCDQRTSKGVGHMASTSVAVSTPCQVDPWDWTQAALSASSTTQLSNIGVPSKSQDDFAPRLEVGAGSTVSVEHSTTLRDCVWKQAHGNTVSAGQQHVRRSRTATAHVELANAFTHQCTGILPVDRPIMSYWLPACPTGNS